MLVKTKSWSRLREPMRAETALVYPTTVKLRPASTPTGRPAKHPVPNRPPCSAAEMLETQRWRRITWRTGTKGPLNARFAAGARRRRAAQCRGHAPAGRGALADRRVARQRREEILPQQPAAADLAAAAGR